MGLEIPEEFWPITPIKTTPTHPIARTRRQDSGFDVNEAKNMTKEDSQHTNQDQEEEEEEEECKTPKSEECHLLKTPLVCPPAPRKPRPMKRKAGFPSQLYFHVPSDLNSVFFPLVSAPSKKMKAM